MKTNYLKHVISGNIYSVDHKAINSENRFSGWLVGIARIGAIPCDLFERVNNFKMNNFEPATPEDILKTYGYE